MHVLIFGYGYMGRIRHHVLQAHPKIDRISVVDPAKSEEDDIGNAVLCSEKDIPWDTIDAVFVCTPNNVTADLVVESLRHCRHVFCEKPPGRDWRDFQRIADAASQGTDGCLMFGFNHRLHPSIEAAKALLGPGGLGAPLYVKGTYGKAGGIGYRDNWRNDVAISGGGILLDQGIHMVDLFHYLIGPMSVRDALLVDAFWKCGVEDNALVLLKSASGVPAFLHSSATLWRHSFHLEIGCEGGYLIASGLLSRTGRYGREQLVVGKRQFEDETSAPASPREEIIQFDRDESWAREVEEFFAAISEGRQPAWGTIGDARQVMAVIRDIYQLRERTVPRSPAKGV